MVSFFRRRLNEMYVQPFHELFSNRGFFVAGFREIQDDEERKACVQAPIVVSAKLQRTVWSRSRLLKP
jgi:hypothetical protein